MVEWFGCGEEVEGSAGLEVFGDGGTEFDGGGAEGGAVEDLGDLFAVGRDDHGVEMPRFIDGVAEGSERELAAAAEGVEDGAFGGDSVLGVATVEGVDGFVDSGIMTGVIGVEDVAGSAGFEGEGALAGGWGELVDGEALVDGLVAFEAV